ncbi:type V toxin-antitoxin system endoribonuclease antitoxin GhoS, partial [Escherichia coli]
MEGKNKFNTYVVSFDYPSSYSSVFLRLRSLMYDMNFSSIVADEYGIPRQLNENSGNDSNLLIVFYVQIMPDDFVMQLHR